MPSDADLANFNAMRQSAGGVLPVLQQFPELPSDVRARFPSLKQYEDNMEVWLQQLQKVLQDLADQVAANAPTDTGPIVRSPNGTRWQIVVDDTGIVTGTAA